MPTRTVPGQLEDLIEQANDVEALGLAIQGDDEAASVQAVAQLDRRYRTWFGTALNVIPQDLEGKFRFEFDGTLFRYRIKQFLDDPHARSGFYESMQAEAREKLNISPWQYPYNGTFRAPLAAQKQLLIEALARFGVSSVTLDGLAQLEKLTRNLPLAFAILHRPIRQRPGLDISDEYDVQRILHAVAALHFEEVQDEDPTPRMAGASSRLDFLLRRERIAIEAKMMRPSLSVRQLRHDLAEDILYFRAHPNAQAIFIFIYDPDRQVTNPRGFEADLYSDSDEFPVRVVVAT